MEFILATPEFEIRGHSYEGFPILLKSNHDVFVEGMEFLVHHCLKRGSVQSRRSWETFGRDLCDYFEFIEANGFDWRELDHRNHETLLALYRDVSFDRFNLNASTVNRRLHLVIKFYQFALKQGWVSTLPYDLETVRVKQTKGFLAHTDTSGGYAVKPDVLLKTTPTRIKVLNKEQVDELLKTTKNKTLRLIVRLALLTGLRKEELLTIPVHYISAPQSISARSHVVVELDPQEMSTKGDKPRTIHVPISLMADLWDYVIHERHETIRKHGTDPKTLFVTAKGNPWSIRTSLNNQLNRLKLSFACHPHILRHTYATHTLKSLLSRKSTTFNPLIYVRDRLGHSSITTTEKYLHFLDDIEDDLRTSYQEEIEETAKEAACA
ncbi:tyrosine-type recombinase/integrase [Marinobacter sp. S6332]|uniref:tyrosine-type recombinase/integrase n=1 Tax=Marinobacter sp. S6332 TaxID=2926403 RepID=UPI001FF1A9E2|nr:tyrosine-type recombinase/integrase [Marinobacter sp. S6332]MCK0165782.1 tyrosine-type recombinase/integrase [Marinobacter sp. S6332]